MLHLRTRRSQGQGARQERRRLQQQLLQRQRRGGRHPCSSNRELSCCRSWAAVVSNQSVEVAVYAMAVARRPPPPKPTPPHPAPPSAPRPHFACRWWETWAASWQETSTRIAAHAKDIKPPDFSKGLGARADLIGAGLGRSCPTWAGLVDCFHIVTTHTIANRPGVKMDVDVLNPMLTAIKTNWQQLPEPVQQVAPFAGGLGSASLLRRCIQLLP